MGFLSKVGGWLNDVTGATSAAKMQHRYQKEFAQNAHQWEVKDLQKAGLNPILSAGGSGATAGGAGGTTGSSGINPLEFANGLVNTGINTVNGIQTAKRTKSETENINADTALKKAQTLIAGIEFDIKSGTAKTEIDRKKAELNKLLEETKLIKQGGIGKTLGTELVEEGSKIIKANVKKTDKKGFGISLKKENGEEVWGIGSR